MTLFRPAAALALAAGLFLALPGCSGDKPKPDDKGKEKDKTDPKPGDPKPADPGAGTPKTPEKVDFNTGVGKEAMDFLKSVADGTVRADKLSVPFLKAIGLPVVFDGDKAKGYSGDEAVSWLRRVVPAVGVPFPSQQVGDVAMIRGGLVGKDGRYALRLVRDGGAWKADALSLSSAKVESSASAPTGEGALQEFAAVSFAELLADKSAMPPQDRAMAAAALMTPALRAKWGDPVFEDDKSKGFDYNRAALARKIAEVGEADSLSSAQQGDTPVFRVEFTKGGEKKAYLIRLVKDAAGRWLVDDVTPQ